MLDTALAATALAAAVATAYVSNRKIRKTRREIARTRRLASLAATSALASTRHRLIDHAHHALASRNTNPRMPLACHAPEGEDLFVYQLLDGQPDGFYIEVGAMDGLKYAVSYLFDAIGWPGLLIEAAPDSADACRANRPHAHVLHAALSRKGSTGTTTFTVLRRDDKDASDSFIGPPSAGKRVSRKRRETAHVIEVPLTTMDNALDTHTPPTRHDPATNTDRPVIDFALIDVEGAEPMLLDGFDLERWQPRVLIIEDLSLGKDSGVRRTVTSAGYTHTGRLGRNDVFVRNAEPELIARARMLLMYS